MAGRIGMGEEAGREGGHTEARQSDRQTDGIDGRIDGWMDGRISLEGVEQKAKESRIENPN